MISHKEEEDITDVEFSFLCPKCGMKIHTSISRLKKASLFCHGECGTFFILGKDELMGIHTEEYSVSLPEILKAVSQKLGRKKREAKA